MDIGSLRRHLKLGPRLARAWQDMEQVTIAAIEGFCIGGGVALAVALDFRIMASNARARDWAGHEYELAERAAYVASDGPCAHEAGGYYG
jgi:hypothetical protein